MKKTLKTTTKIIAFTVLNSFCTILQAQSLDYISPASYDISTAGFNSIALSVATEDNSPYDMIFNSDGTVLYVLGKAGDDINQYDLSTAYDVSTAVFSAIALSVASEDVSPRSMIFNGDGSRLFVLGLTNNDIFQYNLSSNYDISSASFFATVLNVATEEALPTSMVFNNDGSAFYLTGFGNDINQYNLSSSFDLSTASFSGIALDISTNVTNPRSLVFADNGNELYILSSTGTVREVVHYSLSTAYDIATAVFNGDSFSVFAEESSPRSIIVNNKGTNMYVMGIAGDDINQYDIGYDFYPETIANDGSIDNTYPLTIKLSGDTFSTSSGVLSSALYTVGNIPVGLTTTLSIDALGTLAALTFSGNAVAHQNTDDISNLTFTFADGAFSNNVAANVVNSGSVTPFDSAVGINFTDNPRLNYVVDEPYDISIASFNSSVLDVSAQESLPFAMLFNDDGSKLYVTGWDNNNINQYDLTSAFDVSTATFNQVAFIESHTGLQHIQTLQYNNDGNKLYVLVSDGNIWQYLLTTAYDIATAEPILFYPRANIIAADTIDMVYNGDGTVLYVMHPTAKNIKQYNLSTAYDMRTAIEVGTVITFTGIIGLATSLVFNGDGSKLYVTDAGNNTIHQYNLATAYDLTNASYGQITFDLTTTAIIPLAITFNNDGSKLYVSDSGDSSINQFDINQTIYAETLSNDGSVNNSSPLIINLVGDSFSTSSVALPVAQYSVGNVPAGLTPVLNIDSSGTQAVLNLTGNAINHQDINDINDLSFSFTDAAFIGGDAANIVNSGIDSAYSTYTAVNFLDEYRLDYILTPEYDLTSALYSGTVIDFGTNSSITSALLFNNDGRVLYVLRPNGRYIVQYNLTRGYDISTAGIVGTVLSVDGSIISPYSMLFSNDGFELYILDATNRNIHQYNLSNAYDISTANRIGVVLNLPVQGVAPYSMLFNDDGTQLYILIVGVNKIDQYTMTIPFDISTASFSQVALNVSAQETQPRSILFNQDGSKLYVLGGQTDDVKQYKMVIPYDISSAVYDRVAFRYAAQETEAFSMIFNDDGSTLYIMGGIGRKLEQYDLSPTIYQETTANDGIINNTRSLTIKLSNDTFATSGVALPTNQYSIAGMPNGLTAVLNIDVSATTATLAFSGTAANHQDLNDTITNLSFSFSDAAFSNNDASNVVNSGSITPFMQDIEFDFNDNITLTYTVGQYDENPSNIGVIDNTVPITINLAGDITTGHFAISSGVLPADLYVIGRVPAGLTPILTIDSTGTLATLTFSGAATSHQSSNNVIDLPFRFYDAAFINNDADIIVNSGLRPGNTYLATANIDFADNAQLTYLADAPYDVSTSKYLGRPFEVQSILEIPQSMIYNNDGTKLYVMGYNDGLTPVGERYRTIEYNLSTPFDLATAGDSSLSLIMYGSDARGYRSMVFNGDGSILYVLGHVSDTVYQYNLTTNYDISTAGTATTAFNMSTWETNPTAMVYNNDGSILYVLGRASSKVSQFNLSTNFDISTASYVGLVLNASTQVTSASSMIFNGDGSSLYIISEDKQVQEYSLASNFDVATASYKALALNFNSQSPLSVHFSMLYNGDGKKFFIFDNRYTYQYRLIFDDYSESSVNDGSIENKYPLIIKLSGFGNTFSTSSGVLPANQYTIGNIPNGLSPVLSIDASGTQATLTLTGNANSHQNIHDVADLTFSFSNDAFTNANSSFILNSGFFSAFSSNIGIDFADNPGFPVAVDDNYTVRVDGNLILFPLTGDTDPDGDTLSVISLNGVALTGSSNQSIVVPNGVVTVFFGNSFQFVPDANFIGTVIFPYTITDNNGGTAIANQIIRVDVFSAIGGTITGLNGGVSVKLNDIENASLNGNGTYNFFNQLINGSSYLVTINTQPTSPNQTCVLVNASGTVTGTDITNIDITCTTNTYFIGGTVTGLINDNSVVLQNNLSDDLQLCNQTTFVFSMPLADQSAYDTTILTPANNPIQNCSVVNGSSTLAGNDITNVEIVCANDGEIIYRNSFEEGCSIL